MGTEEHHESPKKSRLAKLFEHARIKASGLNPNYDYASELYAECILGDIGNDLYIKAYIETLQKKYNNNRTGALLGANEGAFRSQCRQKSPGRAKVG